MVEVTRTSTWHSLYGKRVLVVEDEPDALDVVAMVLREAGAQVVPAATAGAALASMKAAPFDLVVSDISLPEMDGYTLAGKLRELAESHGTHPRLVAFTGHTTASDRSRAQAAGFDAHIAKPVDPVALVSLVKSLLALA